MRKLSLTLVLAMLSGISLLDAQTKTLPPLPGQGSQAGQLSAAAASLTKGEAEKVFKETQANLLKYNNQDLATALFLQGKARAMMAGKADAKNKQKLFLQAALDFMKVSTFFPYAPEAGPAMAEASKALTAAGDQASAEKVLRELQVRYADAGTGEKESSDK
jgi:hypothetical protein